MPKKKKSTADSSVTARLNAAACNTVKQESAGSEINHTILRFFGCRMGSKISKNCGDNGEKSFEISDGDTGCEDDHENIESLAQIKNIFEKSTFCFDCNELQKDSIKCLLKSKVTLSSNRCLKESVCHICECDGCRKAKEAEKNATSLIAEEERKKKKLEKKKNQKKKRKQQKKAEEEERKGEKEPDTESLKALEKQTKKGPNIDGYVKSAKNVPKIKDDQKVLPSNSKTKSVQKPLPATCAQSSSDEEELNLNSAFVADIAQRKSKASAISNKSPFLETQYTIDFDESAESTDESDSQYSFSSKTECNNTSVQTYQKYEDQKINGHYVDHSFNNDENSDGSQKEDKVNKSVDVGSQANKEALNKNFQLAIDLFKKAIELNPSDYRFYVNRSYCYDCLFDYESALKDAERAISLNYLWPKCYYRKGRALAGLRRYEEAEAAFNKVLELEKYDCKEATAELLRVREEAVAQLGYDKQIASAAANKYNSVREAIYSVVNCRINVTMSDDDDECDSENELILNANLNYPTVADKTPYEVTNPFRWKALWVGNLSPNANEKLLQSLFCKYGVLSHCGLYNRPEGAFALVHYDNPESPRRAMAAYQGSVIKGLSLGDTKKLILRFRPNRDQKQDKYQERLVFYPSMELTAPNEGDLRIETTECYYWRTTGCLRVEDCHFLHIPANKGVDIQPWMITSDGKPRNRLKQQVSKK